MGTACKSTSGGHGSFWRRRKVAARQERFMREGVAGLWRDRTRKPGLPSLPPAVVDRVVALTLTAAPGETTHGPAARDTSGVSLRSVQRTWAAHGFQPHRVLSTNRAFPAKLRDVVGLYFH